MSRSVVCSNCGHSLSMSDDIYNRRVAGKVVTIKCRQCGTPIRVDGRQEAPESSAAARPEDPTDAVLAQQKAALNDPLDPFFVPEPQDAPPAPHRAPMPSLDEVVSSAPRFPSEREVVPSQPPKDASLERPAPPQPPGPPPRAPEASDAAQAVAPSAEPAGPPPLPAQSAPSAEPAGPPPLPAQSAPSAEPAGPPPLPVGLPATEPANPEVPAHAAVAAPRPPAPAPAQAAPVAPTPAANPFMPAASPAFPAAPAAPAIAEAPRPAPSPIQIPAAAPLPDVDPETFRDPHAAFRRRSSKGLWAVAAGVAVVMAGVIYVSGGSDDKAGKKPVSEEKKPVIGVTLAPYRSDAQETLPVQPPPESPARREDPSEAGPVETGSSEDFAKRFKAASGRE